MELAYTLWKAQQAELDKLLFLHGMGGTGALWRPISATLEDHYSILAPDQRAHGGSQAKQTSYTPLDFGNDVIETMKALSFHPAWIIGHSMGVRTATALAHLKPEWVKGLILVDLSLSEPPGGALGVGLLQFLRGLPLHFDSRTAARDYMKLHCPDLAMGQYLLAVSVLRSDGSLTFPFDKDGLIQTLDTAQESSTHQWVRELGERGMPILMIRGGNSLVWLKQDYDREVQEFRDLPSVRFEEIPGAGHGLPFEKKQEFVKKIRDFISSGIRRI